MNNRYDPASIEPDLQQRWEENRAFQATEDPAREKFYCLSMFPYPSGKLHMGHVRNYTIGDVISRYQRMQGKNVLQPMGWDAFGLPAENAAISNQVPPAKWTYDNIAYMKKQLKSLGFAIDWSRELATCDPEYYKWNQWFFLRMLEKGIAYKKTQVVNWDPVDQTVLANEQVIDGRGWRTGAIVEKREIPGYYLGITQYNEELLASLDKLTGWPERVKTMQANWIGRSEGVEIHFPLDPSSLTLLPEGEGNDISPSPSGTNPPGADLVERSSPEGGRTGRSVNKGTKGEGILKVFTTRADTLMGATYVAVATEHPLATYAASKNPELAAFVEECKRGSVMEADLATMEKKGMATGIFVTHPLTEEKIEVWVANYVLMGYGEGAVMAVPAHDERDFHFAKKYQLPIKTVIAHPPPGNCSRRRSTSSIHGVEPSPWRAEGAGGGDGAYIDHGILVNSGKYDGLSYEAAVKAIAADLKAKGLGDQQVQWRLRDWGISRQRYWGCPIPIIHCDHCGDVPVPDDQLPVVLPEDCVPDGAGNPLNKRDDFINCLCPQCGKSARRETDTMDTFVDSSWYYARYCSKDNNNKMIDERINYWMPVDQYIGGIEHAILHLLYSRFWWKVMRDIHVSMNVPYRDVPMPQAQDAQERPAGAGRAGAADPGLVNYDEPFEKLLTQGMVLNEIFYRKPESGRIVYFNPADVEIQIDAKGQRTGAILKSDSKPVESGGIGTMSKSKNNGVDPQALIEKYGADTARLFMMFAAPPEQTLEWSDAGVEGAYRFLKRVWSFCCLDNTRASVKVAKFRDMDWNNAPKEYHKIRRDIYLLLKQANHDFGKFQFNTVASACMKTLNALEEIRFVNVQANAGWTSLNYPNILVSEGVSVLLRLLAPITPHISDYLWRELGYGDDILKAPWPEPDPEALKQDEIELIVQVNGKLRGRIKVPADAPEETIKTAAMEDENVRRFLAGKQVKKVILVPSRLVNIVVS